MAEAMGDGDLTKGEGETHYEVGGGGTCEDTHTDGSDLAVDLDLRRA